MPCSSTCSPFPPTPSLPPPPPTQVFNETLYFPLTLSELEHRTLNMVVSSSEGFGRNTFLGEINLPGQRVSELAVKQPKKPVERELLVSNVVVVVVEINLLAQKARG